MTTKLKGHENLKQIDIMGNRISNCIKIYELNVHFLKERGTLYDAVT